MKNIRLAVPVCMRVIVICSLLVIQGCPVGDPQSGQTIPRGYATDRKPDAGNTDIPYGPDAGQLLDVYPSAGEASGIAIVYVHGGGWVAGSKDVAQKSVVVQYLMDQGHVVFSINYTLGDYVTSPFPANLNDVKWAISWANLQANKSAFGYSRVAVLGESAGAHLASLATVTDHAKPINMPANRSVRPNAGIALGGPSNMVTFGAQGNLNQQMMQRGGFFFGLNLVQCFFGAGYTHPDDVPILTRMAATPDFFVDINDPPVYIASGTNDALALPEYNADLLEKRYIELGEDTTAWAWNDRIEGGGQLTWHIVNIAGIDLYLQLLADGVFD